FFTTEAQRAQRYNSIKSINCQNSFAFIFSTAERKSVGPACRAGPRPCKAEVPPGRRDLLDSQLVKFAAVVFFVCLCSLCLCGEFLIESSERVGVRTLWAV